MIAGRVRFRDKPAWRRIYVDPLTLGRRPTLAGKQRANAPARDPEYGRWHAETEYEKLDLRSRRLRGIRTAVSIEQGG